MAKTKFDNIVEQHLKHLGPFIHSVVYKTGTKRCTIITNYFYPDRSPLTIIALEDGDKIRFTEEGKLFELITEDPNIRYSGRGTEKMDLILSLTKDVQRHFYIEDTIPECYTLGDSTDQQDIVKAFYHLMAICLIIGHLNTNIDEVEDLHEDEDDGG